MRKDRILVYAIGTAGACLGLSGILLGNSGYENGSYGWVALGFLMAVTGIMAYVLKDIHVRYKSLGPDEKVQVRSDIARLGRAAFRRP